jgi:hypothetical protein
VFVVLVPRVKGRVQTELATILKAVGKVEIFHMILAVGLLAEFLAAYGTAVVGPAALIHSFYVSLQQWLLIFPRQQAPCKQMYFALTSN